MKKIFLLLLVLCAVVLTSCDDNVETIPPKEDENQTENDKESNEEITIIKGGDSFALEVEESKEVNLSTYFSYEGTKYFYVVTTEDKNVVETDLLNSTLTVYAVSNGTEVVTFTLNDKKVDSYEVILEITYVKDLGYDKKVSVVVVQENDTNRWSIVESKPVTTEKK